jgi:tetratricopeptide (TPR) repeat protein
VNSHHADLYRNVSACDIACVQVCVAEVNALMSEPDTPFVELLELAVSRRDAAPYLVGPPPTPYFGYKTQLRSLVEMLTRPYSRAFVSLGGHAGCGMKSFLRVAAASLRDFGCYPGGIYYLDLHGTEQEDVAARCERELLLLTGSAASSLDAWCRTLTQRACVLIDGGSTLSSDLKAVFRPFVGTTLNVVGASVASTELECDLWLGGLDADSVSALVQQLAPYLLTSCGLDCVMRRTSALPEAIMRVCRMTPSAAVAALKHDGPLFPDPSRPMGLTASGLHDSPTFSAVDARTTAAMAKLRVFPGSFDIAAASDVLGYRDYADTTDLLAKLVGLEWLHDKGDGRWMCNNNVPTTVNNAPVSVDVLAAFVRYYVALINETERQFVGSSPSTGLTLFDTERDSINKVLGMFVTAASQPERVLQELVALRSFEILHARLTHEELEAVIAGIGTALESLHYFASPLVGYHLYAKGRAHHHNPTVAIDCFSKAIGMFLPASAYVKEIALCNLGLADVQRQQGDLAEARSTLEAAIASVIGNDVDVAFLRARLYMELGSVWMDLHESRKAISQYSDALINLVYAIPQLGDHVLVATLKARTGKAHVAQQKYAEAWKELEEAMRSRRKMFGAVHEEIAATMEERGECALAWCRYDLAVSEFQAAVDTYTTVYGDQHVAVARAMIGLAKAQASAGDLDTADATYTASLRILRGQPSPPACIKDALMNFAELKIVLGDPDASAALQREATTLPRFDSRVCMSCCRVLSVQAVAVVDKHGGDRVDYLQRFIVPRPSPRRESSLSSLLPVPGSPVAVRPPAPPAVSRLVSFSLATVFLFLSFVTIYFRLCAVFPGSCRPTGVEA